MFLNGNAEHRKNSRAKCFDVQCFNKSDLRNVDCLWCVFVCICVSLCVILYYPKFAFTKLSEDMLPHAAQQQYGLFRRQRQGKGQRTLDPHTISHLLVKLYESISKYSHLSLAVKPMRSIAIVSQK